MAKLDDRDSTCAFQMNGRMFIIGGWIPDDDEDRLNTARDNFEVFYPDSQPYKLEFIRLPDLPIEFQYGRCASFSHSSRQLLF